MKRLSVCLSAVFLLPVSANAEVVHFGTGTTIVTEISREGRITGSYYSRHKVQTQDIVRKRQKPVFAGSVTIEPAKKVVKKAAVKAAPKVSQPAPAKPVAAVKMPAMPEAKAVPAMVKPSQGVMPKMDVVNDMPMQATDSDMRKPAMPVSVDHAPRGSHEQGNLPSVPASDHDREMMMRR